MPIGEDSLDGVLDGKGLIGQPQAGPQQHGRTEDGGQRGLKHVVDLSAYAGRLVWVQIAVRNNPSYNSSLHVDDVSFQATASSAVDSAATLDEGSGDPGPDESPALPRAGAGQPIR